MLHLVGCTLRIYWRCTDLRILKLLQKLEGVWTSEDHIGEMVDLPWLKYYFGRCVIKGDGYLIMRVWGKQLFGFSASSCGVIYKPPACHVR